MLQPPSLLPLWGGGFLVAFAQLTAFYYGLGALLHWGLPALLPTQLQGIQAAPRKQGEVSRDALSSLGVCVRRVAGRCVARWVFQLLGDLVWARVCLTLSSAASIACLPACLPARPTHGTNRTQAHWL
jgi:hypothetical protein